MGTFAQECDALRQMASLPQRKPSQGCLATSQNSNPILHLQRTIGNRATQRLLAARPQTSGRVTHLRHPETGILLGAGTALQRKCAECEQEETKLNRNDDLRDAHTITPAVLTSSEDVSVIQRQSDGDDAGLGASNDGSQTTSTDAGQGASDAGAKGCQIKIYSGKGCDPSTLTNTCSVGQCCAAPMNHFVIGDANSISSYKGSCSGPKLEMRANDPDVPCSWFYKDGGSEFLFSAMYYCPVPIA